ncbi:MAG: hypothetical protein ACYDCL_04375 [Myxococcales bacterium]
MRPAGNLAAFLLGAGAFACAHARAATLPERPIEVTEAGFRGRFAVPEHPIAGAPALLVLPSPLSAKLAQAAVDAGIGALTVESGSAGQALLWLGPRAKRIYVAAEGGGAGTAAELAESGHVAGLVLIEPPTAAIEGDLPCLVVDGGPAASRQSGHEWHLTLPELRTGASVGAETEHTLLEAMALWLRARASEP